MKDPARHAALRLVLAVDEGHQMLMELRAGPILRGLEPEEEARALRLADAMLRWGGRSTSIWREWVPRQPPSLVRWILNLAVVEMLEYKIPPYAAVSAAMSLADSISAARRAKPMINAVLRRLSREYEATLSLWQNASPEKLPDWIERSVLSAWGQPAYEHMLAAYKQAPIPNDLTFRLHPDETEPVLSDIHESATRLPGGSVRVAGSARISALKGYAEGRFWVQDAAAAWPARLLQPKKGERILDLCAAPGGKTMQLASQCDHVVAVERSQKRLKKLRENLNRTGLEAKLIKMDARAYSDEEGFDKILLDAPCSGSGTIRRHPDFPYVKNWEDITGLFSIQEELLNAAIRLLRPGGRLLYCTCSIFPEEGEERIEKMLAHHDEISVIKPEHDELDARWFAERRIGHNGEPLGLRILPGDWLERGGVDGFFISLLTRKDH